MRLTRGLDWGIQMHRFIARANIDHFIGLLGGDLTPSKRADIVRLLIAELDKLALDLEHLEFAEKKVADGRDRLNHVRGVRNGHPHGTPEREQAERLLVGCENLQTLLEDFCHHLRRQFSSRGI